MLCCRSTRPTLLSQSNQTNQLRTAIRDLLNISKVIIINEFVAILFSTEKIKSFKAGSQWPVLQTHECACRYRDVSVAPWSRVVVPVWGPSYGLNSTSRQMGSIARDGNPSNLQTLFPKDWNSVPTALWVALVGQRLIVASNHRKGG